MKLPDYGINRIDDRGIARRATALRPGWPPGRLQVLCAGPFDRSSTGAHPRQGLSECPGSHCDQAGQAYPNGSVLIMEWRKDGKDGEIVRLDVMRKEQGYGAAYGADKNGDWEYASYSPDGKLITDAAASLACAKCHLKAGSTKDFVYAGRFALAQ